MRNPIAQGIERHAALGARAVGGRILRELQQDGIWRNDMLAERIALTPEPNLRRVRALEKAGVTRCCGPWQ
jgi:DNA-binding Lrp family transcriptional regulator